MAYCRKKVPLARKLRSKKRRHLINTRRSRYKALYNPKYWFLKYILGSYGKIRMA